MQLTTNTRFSRAQEVMGTLNESFKDLWPVMNKLVPLYDQQVLLRYSTNDSGAMEFMLTKMHGVLIGYLCWRYQDEVFRDAAYLKYLQHFRGLEIDKAELIFNLYEQVPVDKLPECFDN